MDQQLFDTWKLLAGIGIFLFGMSQLETALKELAGRSFKNLLQKFTDKIWKGILIGALITAILQSSSLVTLMILAFLGAKLINLRNAIGVILGANLGTTITAWIVASLGFKLSISGFALPFLGIGSLVAMFFSNRPLIKNIGYFAFGFGLLFLGLDFMKTSIEELATQVNLSDFLAYGLWVFLIIGIVITALIQSSSAVIVIALSAINAEVIGLHEAAAILIGANIGTTITVSIGALKGSSDKKRLASAHFIFNVVTGLIAFIFLNPLLSLSNLIFSTDTYLMQLVLFNTLLNAFGIILFYPLINSFEKFLSKQFKSSEAIGVSQYIKNVSVEVPGISITAIEKEMEIMLQKFILFANKIIGIQSSKLTKQNPWLKLISKEQNSLKLYEEIKLLEDELTLYHLQLQEQNLNDTEAEKLTSLMLSLRQIVYAAKDLKDVNHNFIQLKESESIFLKGLLEKVKYHFENHMNKVLKYHKNSEFEDTRTWLEENQAFYQILINDLYKNINKLKGTEIQVSTITNLIKQTNSALDNIGIALIHWKTNRNEVLEEGFST